MFDFLTMNLTETLKQYEHRYATDSCLFEVAALYPQLRDELLGREQDWSFFTTSEMAKCRDTKNKFVRTLKSGRATVVNRRTAVPFAATTGLTASLSVLIAYTASLTNAALASIAALTVNFGDFKLSLASLTLVVAELFAGIYQATVLYNWARVSSYMNCASKYGESDHRLRDLFDAYENLKERMDTAYKFCLDYSTVVRNQIESINFESESFEKERYKSIVQMLYESTRRMNELSDRFGQETKDLSFVYTFVTTFDTNDARHRWAQKDKKEFRAEIFLNPLYWLLETLYPNPKYGDVPIKIDGEKNIHEDAEGAEEEVEVDDAASVEPFFMQSLDEFEYILSHKSSPEFSRDLEGRFMVVREEEEEDEHGYGVAESKSDIKVRLDVAERHTRRIHEELNNLETTFWKEVTDAKDRLFSELRETFEVLCASIEPTDLERLQKFPFCIEEVDSSGGDGE